MDEPTNAPADPVVVPPVLPADPSSMQSNYGASGRSTPVVEETSPKDNELPTPVAEQVKAGGIQGDTFPSQGVTLDAGATVSRTDLSPPPLPTDTKGSNTPFEPFTLEDGRSGDAVTPRTDLKSEVPRSDLSIPPSAVPEVPPTPVATPPSRSIVRELLEKGRAVLRGRKARKLDKIMAEIERTGKITNDQVEKLLHCSDATATRYLLELERSGRIWRSGSRGRGVHYFLKVEGSV